MFFKRPTRPVYPTVTAAEKLAILSAEARLRLFGSLILIYDDYSPDDLRELSNTAGRRADELERAQHG